MSVRKNTLMMALYEILVYLAPLITAPYIARVLGTSGTGVYSYTFSIASYFVIAIQLGVSIYGRREIASKLTKEERSKSFWTIFSCLFISFGACSIGFLLVSMLVDSNISEFLKWQYPILIAGWLDVGWFFFGIEEFRLAVSRNLVVKLLSLVLVFILIRSSEDTLKYIILMSLTNVLSVFVMWCALPRYITKVRITIKEILCHVKPLFVLAIPVISIQLYSITDKVFLGAMMNLDSVGIYENMYKLSRVPVALITTMGTILLPRITNMIALGQEKETFRYVNKSLSLTLIMASSCSFGMIAISPWLVSWYYGEEFVSGVPVLRILSFILIIVAWGNVFRNQFIIPRKMDRIYIVSVVAAAIINIILNVLFIPVWGMIGAAIASVISETVVCVYQCVKIKAYFDFVHLLRINFLYILSGLFMCLLVNCVGHILSQSTVLSILLLFAVGVLSFLVISLVFELFAESKILQIEMKRCLWMIGKKVR